MTDIKLQVDTRVKVKCIRNLPVDRLLESDYYEIISSVRFGCLPDEQSFAHLLFD